jgi:hypothetical protein
VPTPPNMTTPTTPPKARKEMPGHVNSAPNSTFQIPVHPSTDVAVPMTPTPQPSPELSARRSTLATGTPKPSGQHTAAPRTAGQHFDAPAAQRSGGQTGTTRSTSPSTHLESPTNQPRRSSRAVHAPKWHSDYII